MWEGIGLSNLSRAGYLDIVDFNEIFSYQYLSHLTKNHVTIDLAFIDGNHMFDYVLVDFFLIDKLLRPGGIVIMDDLSYPSIRSVCRYVLLYLRYNEQAPKRPICQPGEGFRSVARRFAAAVHSNSHATCD